MEADEWHTEECANLLEKMNSEEQLIALEGAVKGAQLLWNFLDEMQEIHLNN
jgi:pyrroloquinoline-quinone synthase